MTENTMRLTLKPGEKMFLNGAVIRFDRKTRIEILNNASFLLEAHVLQADETDTPLKQLYYAAQIMLMDPKGCDEAARLFREMLARLITVTANEVILSALHDCSELAEHNRIFDMLKLIRGLFPLEAEILKKSTKEPSIRQFSQPAPKVTPQPAPKIAHPIAPKIAPKIALAQEVYA